MGQDMDIIRTCLFKLAMKGEWARVVEIYEGNQRVHKLPITKSGDTALHIAVNDGEEKTVLDLVSQIQSKGPDEARESLKVANDSGNTALHYAAEQGNVNICKCIAQADPSLVGARNNDNETPFFLAALHGKKDAFLRLHIICHGEGSSYCRRAGGETILHAAIAGEYFDLAFEIIHLYGELVNSVDEHGTTPLHLLASKPTVFRSSTHLPCYQSIIYKCTFVDELKPQKVHQKGPQRADSPDMANTPCYPETYQTCCDLLRLLGKVIGVVMKLKQEREGDAEDQRGPGQELFPPNYGVCFDIVKLLSKTLLVVVGLGSSDIKKLEEKKRKHTWSAQVMNELLQGSSMYEYDFTGSSPHGVLDDTQPYELMDGGDIGFASNVEGNQLVDAANKAQSMGSSDPGKRKEGEDQKTFKERKIEIHMLTPQKNDAAEILAEAIVSSFPVEEKNLDKNKLLVMAMEKPETQKTGAKETPILIAAKNGIKEMVEKILEKFPVAIQDMNADKKNIVLLSVENRQPHVYDFLVHRKGTVMKESVLRKVDNKGNSALHLAATMGDYKPWRIPGAALQMQWEFKWYEYVKVSKPPDFFPRHNKDGKTAKDIFTDSHKELIKSSGEWLTNTSASCSVVAALIATVAFATSATVPGGVNQESGSPTLEKQPAFNVFAISSLVALCFSVTAVVMFLSILTSRHQEKDFGRDLPKKLLFGLTSLFISIASILVSFCAGHFFVLRDELKFAAFPVYAVTCLPVTFFAIAQFPLYFDLLWALFKSVPQRSYVVVS